MRKLPVISSDDVVKALKKAGFVYAPKHGKGSHIALYKIDEKGHKLLVIVPKRRELPKGAEKLYNESLAIKKEFGDKRGIAIALHQLGMLQQNRGNYKEAIQAFSEAASIFKKLQAPYLEDVIRGLAKIEKEIGKNECDKIFKSLSKSFS
jgi:predicted RNA binding protein YcfA (HicA-like mRNA interferase family)